ncbi:MAG: DNA primase [Oscillospiraceae bacterium]|nr:DNA primase [Oscillospiraceae bacterium]
MMFPPAFLDEVTFKTDIVELISGYTTLKSQGGRWIGLCPFHNEKTPSFNVTPEKQAYYCFGCGAGGGVVQFVQNVENLSFQEAIAFLASRVGLVLPEHTYDDRHKLITRLLDIHREAARWFHEQLRVHQSAADYLQRRRLSPAIVKRFGVGYAPDSWDALLKFLTAKGYSKDDLLKAGLIAKNQKGGYYDKFRHRIMFPILDVRKRVIAFGGRAIGAEAVKYLNSPETPIFSKSRELYALHEAKATKGGRIILTEGYLDTLALYQAGFDCAVASLGTAFTAHHAAMIARYAKEAVIAFDSDEAGKKAAARAAPILQMAGLNVRVLSLQGAKDPDEFIQLKGRDAFARLLDHAQTHADHSLAEIAMRHDLETDAGRVAFLKDAVAFIALLASPIEREVYTGRAAELAKVNHQVVAAEVERMLGKRRKQETRQSLRTVGGNTHGAKAKLFSAEEDLLRLLLTDPTLWDKLPPDFNEDKLSDPFAKDIFARLKQTRGGVSTLDLTQEQSGKLGKLLQKPSAAAPQAIKDCLTIIETQSGIAEAEGDDKVAILLERRRQQN